MTKRYEICEQVIFFDRILFKYIRYQFPKFSESLVKSSTMQVFISENSVKNEKCFFKNKKTRKILNKPDTDCLFR